MNEVEVHERENFTSPVRTETFPSDYPSQMGRTLFSPGFSSSELNPLQSLLDHNFSQQPHGGSYSNWSSAEHNLSHNGGSIGFPSQVLTKKESFGSKFSDNSESSLFSGSVNLATLEPEFSNFSASPLSKAQSSSVGTSHNDNQLGLSDITKRLEGLSNVPLSPQSKSRGSTPSSWHPMMSISSKASSLTPSPVAGLSHTQGTFLPQALPKSQSSRVQLFMGKEDNYNTSSDDEEKIQHMFSATPQKQLRPGLQLSKCISQQQQCQSAPCSPQPASWSQVVRTSSVTPARPSPPPRPQLESRLVVEEVPHSSATVDYHRGPRVDPRWPVAQQVFLGPIPKSVSWDEIRNVFYTKVETIFIDNGTEI